MSAEFKSIANKLTFSPLSQIHCLTLNTRFRVPSGNFFSLQWQHLTEC